MPTYACPASCKHCGTLSTPHDKNSISLEIIKSAIDQAKELNFSNVVFTGGEATLRWKDLIIAIKYSSDLGFPVRLVTNAHWAGSSIRATKVIKELIASGLTEINYSTGDEHVKFIPISNIIYAIAEALKTNLAISVMIEQKAGSRITKAMILNDPLIQEIEQDVLEKLLIIEGPWMPLNPYLVEKYPNDVKNVRVANSNNLAAYTGCASVLQTYVVQADGRIGSCCGIGQRIIPELNVANVSDKSFLKKSIKDSEEDFLKLWIHYIGPERILAWAAKKDPSIEWENMYAHICQACLRIYKDPKVRKVIKEHYSEMFSEVVLTAFMNEVFIPTSLEKNLTNHR